MELINKYTIDYLEEFAQELRIQVKIENMGEIIDEYKRQNKIDVLTDEEFTNIFGESTLYPHYSLPVYGNDFYYGILISDYELYIFRQGIDLIEDPGFKLYLEYEDEMRQSEDGCDLGDADRISQGEWECELQDEQDYYLSIRTKTIELYVDNMNDLDKVLHEPIHETISHLIIHMEANAKKFLIVVTIEEQLIFYRVFHQIDLNSPDNLKSLGWDIYPESVLEMIDYFIETGLTIRCYQ